jgi:hypothetical protein
MVELMGHYSKMNSQAVRLRELLDRAPDQVVSRPRQTKQPQTRLSSDRLKAFAEAYQAGMAIPGLIEEFKVSRATVYGIVKRLGLPGRHSTLRTEDVDEACRLYLDGSSLTDISGRFSVAPNTIRKELISRHIALRGPNEPRRRGRQTLQN